MCLVKQGVFLRSERPGSPIRFTIDHTSCSPNSDRATRVDHHGENPSRARVGGMGENVRTTTLSLWSGGLFYRLCRRTRLLRNDPLDVLRRSVALLIVAWAPLVVLVLVQGLLTKTWHPLLFYLPHHIRWWVAVPLLFTAENLIDA